MLCGLIYKKPPIFFREYRKERRDSFAVRRKARKGVNLMANPLLYGLRYQNVFVLHCPQAWCLSLNMCRYNENLIVIAVFADWRNLANFSLL
jgi:hypothetical protein